MMNLRKEAIRAMQKQAKNQGWYGPELKVIPAALDGLLGWLREYLKSDDGNNPSYNPRHATSMRCGGCGWPLATDAAWDELEEGEGTNLCWEETFCKGPNGDSSLLVATLIDLLSATEEQRTKKGSANAAAKPVG